MKDSFLLQNHRYNTSNLINVTCSTQLLSDEIDAGTTDCIEKGNVVSDCHSLCVCHMGVPI